MRSIVHYHLVPGLADVDMPAGARLLGVDKLVRGPAPTELMQGITRVEIPIVWAVVDPNQPMRVRRRLAFVATHAQAEPPPCHIPDDVDNSTYVGCLRFTESAVVGHLFDFGEAPSEPERS